MKAAKDLPQNIDAEKSVLGALLIENGGFDRVEVEAADFFRDVHRKIFRSMRSLHDEGKPVDLRLVAEALEKQGLFEDVGGGAYLASLVDGVPRSTNVEYYAQIVRDKAILRRLIAFGVTVIEGAHANDAEPRDLLVRADVGLADVANTAKIHTGASPVASDLAGLAADLDYRMKHRGQISGLPTGFPEVDLLTHGWQRCQMVVIAGQTSFGKSVLALDTAYAIAAAGHRVIYYSYEMTRKELAERLWSKLSEIPLTRIHWGNVSAEECIRLQAARDILHELPLEINDGSSRAIVDARSECRQVKADRGLAAVVFDHFQLMEGVAGENRTQELGAISRRIQKLGVELDVTTFALSQLTLSGAEAAMEPQLEHLRECKQLGHDANVVMMLHPYKPAEVRTDTPVVPFKLLCRKNRGGRIGVVPLHMERDYVRFVPGEAPAVVPRATKKGKSAEESSTVY